MAEEKTRYSDAELAEFKELILKSLKRRAPTTNCCARRSPIRATTIRRIPLRRSRCSKRGATTLSKEESGRLAAHQMKFIRNLEMALVRIENKTYGICKTTGKLIPKERLMKVPHATECIEARRTALTSLRRQRLRPQRRIAFVRAVAFRLPRRTVGTAFCE